MSIHPTRPGRVRGGHLLAAVALTTLAAAFFAVRLVFRGRGTALVNSDVLLYFYPIYEATYARLATGTLPLWNPYQLCGIPWLATLQGGFFYPGHVLYLFLPTYVALAASTLLHFVLVALATALFAREVGLAPAAAVLAAILFTLRGTIPNLTLFPNALEAATWLPVGCLGVLRLARGQRAPSLVIVAVATAASFLAGYPQETVFLIYAWATLLPTLLVSRRAGVRRWLGTPAVFGAALALGALTAAVALLPAAELSRAGAREAQQLTTRLMFPMGGWLLGNPIFSILRATGITGSQFSFGVIGLSLLPAALFGRRHRALALWALVFGLLTLAFALGPATPLFGLYLALPLLGWFRLPSRIFILTDFSFAILAGVALDVLLHMVRRERQVPVDWRSRVGMAAPIVAALAMAAFEAWRGHWLPIPFALGATAALVLAGWRHWSLAPALVFLAGAELFAAPSPGMLRPYRPSVAATYGAHAETYEALAARAGHDRVWVFAPGLMPDLGPKLPTRYGVRAISDYEPVNLRRQSEYFLYFADGPARPTRHFPGDVYSLAGVPAQPPPGTRRRLLDLAAMRFFLTTTEFLAHADVGRFVTDAGLVRLPDPEPDLALFENPHALPRAFVVYRTRPAPEPARLLPQLGTPSFDPLAESFVEGEPGFALAPDAPNRGDAATFIRDDEMLVEVEATLAAPGLVVLADSFYTGWRASVDGIPVPILPTNQLFRGVPVPAGIHRVRFEYHPWTVPAGAALSLAGVLAIAALCMWRGGLDPV